LRGNLYTDRSFSSIFFSIFLYTCMIFLGITTLYPFINVLAISLNQSYDTVRGGIYLIPREFTLESYKQIFAYGGLLSALKISVLRTVIGSVTTVFLTTMLAYTISRRDFIARKFVSVLFVITMYVNGGLIPTFVLMRNIGLTNSFWVYIIPGFVGVWGVFVVRSFIDNLPPSLQESAKLDGANDFIIFIKVVLPLCIPVLATIALFSAVGQWNSWFDTYIYNGTNKKLSTLQYEMMKILTNTEALKQLVLTGNRQDVKLLASTVSPESMRMALTIVATVPILMVYPFIQRYFIQGLTLGGVKG